MISQGRLSRLPWKRRRQVRALENRFRAEFRASAAGQRWLLKPCPDPETHPHEPGVLYTHDEMNAVPFGTGRDFERGVEYGILWARAKDHGRAEMAVHADMAELVIRLAEAQGKPFSAQPHRHDEDCRERCDDGGDWLDVVIG
jgi:hypothetical protein